MKTLIKVAGIAILGCGMILAIFAFILEKPEMSSTQEQGKSASLLFPELLVRNEALKQTAEWQSNVHRVSALSSRLIQNPEDAEATIELAQIYTIEARVTGEHGYYFPAILTMLDDVLKQDQLSEKDLFEATALKANVLLSQHRFAEGLKVAEQAHVLNPYSAQVFAALIDANVELGNYAQAVELTDQMMEIRPGLMAYARASYLRELHGDIEGAVEAMKMAVEAGYPGYENTEWCRIHLGELYEQQGDLEMAESHYKTSAEVRTNNPFALAAIGRVRMARGQYAEAEMILKEALVAIPEIGFQEDLFRLYKAWGKEKEAEDAYQKVIAMVEDDAAHGHRVDLDYAKILFDLGGDTDQALERVLREYEVRPENIEVNTLLARIYSSQGKTDLAKVHLAKALKTGHSSPEIEELKVRLS